MFGRNFKAKMALNNKEWHVKTYIHQSALNSTAHYLIEVRYLDQGMYHENSTKGVWSFFSAHVGS